MIRIHGHRSESIHPKDREDKPPLQSLYELPVTLPEKSHTTISPIEVGHLFLPEGTDLSRISSRHPIDSLFRKIWLEVVSKTFIPPPRRE